MQSYDNLAEFYDYLNRDCDYEKWSQYLLSLLESRGVTAGSGCDFGCGSGILTNKLAEYGYNMTGADVSEPMLRAAYSRRHGENVRFVLGDMRSFEFARRQNFINASCDGVNYLNPDCDFIDFIKTAGKGLLSGGVLMFDVSSRYKLREILGNNIFADDTDDVTYVWQNDLKKNCVDMQFIIFTRTNGAYYKKYDRHKMYLYDEEQVLKTVRQNGFTRVEAYDAFTLSPPRETSERIQFIATKE